MAILKLKNKTTGEWEEIQAIKGNGISSIEKTATVGNKDTYTIYFTNGSTTTYEVSNGEVTREELEEEVERLSMIYNAFPSTTGEVEEGSINGTAEVPFKEIGLKGNTSQNGEPTPDTPIPVNVVTGDNSITISNNDNTQSQTYPINLGSMELCKIGDYQDYIARSTGKNLFDKNSQDILENVRIGADGGNNADSGYFISEFIEVRPNTKYTKNTTADAYHRFAFYTDKSISSFISKSEDNTITTPSNAKYLRICGLITEKNSIMLNEGSTATPYEPYGKVWYKYGAIGKIASYNGETITKNYISTTGGLDTGSTIYYVQNTPTVIPITDTTLIEQLDNLEKTYSYDTQTNISQTNQDKPFIISYEAILSLRNVLNKPEDKEQTEPIEENNAPIEE